MKKRNLNEWKEETIESQKDKMQREIQEAEKKKNDAKNMEAITFQVWAEAGMVLETHHESEAIRMAKGINAKVVRCIEHAGLEQVYPVPEYKN